jgi:hypothetical protein
MEFYSAMKKNEIFNSQLNGWNWRTSFWARLAKIRRTKNICSPQLYLGKIQQCGCTWVTS